MNRFAKAAVAAVVAFAAAGSAAQAADRITASLWVGPKHPVTVGGYDPMIKALEDSGDWNVKYFQGGALLGAKPTLSGLRDGIADVGMMAMTYFPAEFPRAQVVADMGLSTPSALVAMFMASEFNLLHCQPCLDEYLAQDIVYTGTYSSSPYTLISKEPIRSTADLAGKKMRVPGSLWSRWAAKVGGIEVNVPSSEMYEGLDKGALDIAIQAPGAMRSYSLWDTAKYNTVLNLGTYHSLSLLSFNQRFWQDQDEAARKMFLEQAARAGVQATMLYTEADEEVLAAAAEHGVEIIQPSDEMKADKAAFVEGDTPMIVSEAKDKYGIDDAQAMVDTLNGLIEKWTAIVDEIGEDDQDALVARFMEEVYNKLPADYGL